MSLFCYPAAISRGVSARNWLRTMANPLQLPDLTNLLTPAEMRRLRAAHPDQQVRAWAYRRDLGMRPGDLVLFPGEGKLHHVGKVGTTFHTSDNLGDIWDNSGTYEFAMTFPHLVATEDLLDYQQFLDLRGLKQIARSPSHIPDTQVADLMGYLAPALDILDVASAGVGATGNNPSRGKIRRSLTSATTSAREAADIKIHYRELALVERFESYVETERGGTCERLQISGHEVDAVTTIDGVTTLIEAKGYADPTRIRTAMGQLLSYSWAFRPTHFKRCAILLPAPAEGIETMLDHYGIDLITETSHGTFNWHTAPQDRLDALHQLIA